MPVFSGPPSAFSPTSTNSASPQMTEYHTPLCNSGHSLDFLVKHGPHPPENLQYLPVRISLGGTVAAAFHIETK